jgi:hypothetical protein
MIIVLDNSTNTLLIYTSNIKAILKHSQPPGFPDRVIQNLPDSII